MYDETQSEPLTEADTPNHTKFHPNDDRAEYDGTYRLDGTATFEQHFSRLAKLNTGVWNGSWEDKELLYRNDNLAIFDAIAGQLELTNYQKQVGRQVFEQLNLRELTDPVVDTPLVAVMTAAVVVRRDGRFYHPQRLENTNDAVFLDLLDSFDYSVAAIERCYAKVLHRVNL